MNRAVNIILDSRELLDAKLVEEAERWLGTPFVHQARGPRGATGGADCVGMLAAVGEACGAFVEDFSAYGRYPSSSLLLEQMAKMCDRVSRLGDPTVLWKDPGAFEHLRPGRVVLFYSTSQAAPHHAGIDAGDGRFIHTHAGPSCGVVMYGRWAAWTRKLHSVWSYRWQL